jgi:hypothetical protein
LLITQSRPSRPARGQTSKIDEGVTGGPGGGTGVGCGVGDVVFPEQAIAMLRPMMASVRRPAGNDGLVRTAGSLRLFGKQMCCKGLAKCVAAGPLRDSCSANGGGDRTLHGGFVQMIPGRWPEPCVSAYSRRGTHKLPAPFGGGVGVAGLWLRIVTGIIVRAGWRELHDRRSLT